jgi:hypothetical protein
MLPCRFIIEFVPHSGRRARSSNPALRAVGSLLSHRTSPSVSVRRSTKLVNMVRYELSGSCQACYSLPSNRGRNWAPAPALQIFAL